MKMFGQHKLNHFVLNGLAYLKNLILLRLYKTLLQITISSISYLLSFLSFSVFHPAGIHVRIDPQYPMLVVQGT